MYSRLEVAACAKRVNRSVPTIWRWIKAGCRINDAASLEAFRIEMERKKTNIARARERRSHSEQKTSAPKQTHTPSILGMGELPPAGRKGAAAALERLEAQEERAHARLEAALARGDPTAIDATQTFWLKCSETLRRLDLAVETARREAETQIPLRTAKESVLACAEWFRISFMQFLSSEGSALMGIRDFGEWKTYAVARFRGGLDLTVKASLKTNSPIPSWASEQIQTAWNIRPD